MNGCMDAWMNGYMDEWMKNGLFIICAPYSHQQTKEAESRKLSEDFKRMR